MKRPLAPAALRREPIRRLLHLQEAVDLARRGSAVRVDQEGHFALGLAGGQQSLGRLRPQQAPAVLEQVTRQQEPGQGHHQEAHVDLPGESLVSTPASARRPRLLAGRRVAVLTQ